MVNWKVILGYVNWDNFLIMVIGILLWEVFLRIWIVQLLKRKKENIYKGQYP